MKIEIVPHPSRYHVTTPDKRGLFWCDACKDATVEPFNRPHYKPVRCERCKQPCQPKMEVLFKDQMGVALEGVIVAYCKAEPDGWIARCQQQPMAEYIRAEIKAVVDKKYGGDAVWTDGGIMAELPDQNDEDDDEVGDTDLDEDGDT